MTRASPALLLTPAEAGLILKVSPRTVRRLCERRELHGVRVGGQWRIPMAAIERLTTPADVPTPQRPVATEPVTSASIAAQSGPGIRIFNRRDWETA